MAQSFQAKDSQVYGRQLKTQRLTIPLTVTGSATAANVVPASDEPSILFMKTAGVDQITPALASGETVTYSTGPTDATGVFNVLLKLNEQVAKVVNATLWIRTSGANKAVSLCDNSTGLSSAGNIGLTVASTVDFATPANLDGTIVVEYVTVAD